jgi:SAM-dependent methyltransferase
MNDHMDFAADLAEGHQRLSGQSLIHFKSRVEKAAHILAELRTVGIAPDAQLRVLFAGSGTSFIPYILARHTAWVCYGGEFNPEYLLRHPWVQQRVRLARLDGTAMPFPDATFDVVVCNHVIEHVPDWETLARELHRMVRPKGVLYLATPNIHRPNVPLGVLVKNKKTVSRQTRIDRHMGFSLSELKRLLADFEHLQVFNRAHVYINCPRWAKPLLALVPTTVYDQLTPNHVVIARK